MFGAYVDEWPFFVMVAAFHSQAHWVYWLGPEVSHARHRRGRKSPSSAPEAPDDCGEASLPGKVEVCVYQLASWPVVQGFRGSRGQGDGRDVLWRGCARVEGASRNMSLTWMKRCWHENRMGLDGFHANTMLMRFCCYWISLMPANNHPILSHIMFVCHPTNQPVLMDPVRLCYRATCGANCCTRGPGAERN